MTQPQSPADDELAYAESRLLQTRRDLQQLETALYETLLPVWYWSLAIQRYLHFVEARYRRAQRDYYRLLKPAKPNSAEPPQNEPPPPPEPTERRAQCHYQSAEVKVVEGQAVTTIVGHRNDYWLSGLDLLDKDEFWRQITFSCRPIPEPYAEILRRHNIAVDPAPRGLFLYYQRADFLQLCREEIESGAQHFTEGNPESVRPLI